MPRKGLLVNVLRHKTDCSFHGVSSRYDSFVMTTTAEESGRFHDTSVRVFEVSDNLPELRLCVEYPGFSIERICLRPVNPETGEVYKTGFMASGNFVYTSDSRFPRVDGHSLPLPLHDRCEHDDTRRKVLAMYPGLVEETI